MLIPVYLPTVDAIRLGLNKSGNLEIEVDPSTLTAEDRELLADEFSSTFRPQVATLDAEGLIASLRARRDKRLAESKEIADHMEAAIQAALARTTREIVRVQTVDGVEKWELPYIGAAWSDYPDDPRIKELFERITPEIDAHNAEADRQIEEKRRIRRFEQLEQENKKLGERLDTVSQLLAHVPMDAIKGAARRLAEDTINAKESDIIEKAETASTFELGERD